MIHSVWTFAFFFSMNFYVLFFLLPFLSFIALTMHFYSTLKINYLSIRYFWVEENDDDDDIKLEREKKRTSLIFKLYNSIWQITFPFLYGSFNVCSLLTKNNGWLYPSEYPFNDEFLLLFFLNRYSCMMRYFNFCCWWKPSSSGVMHTKSIVHSRSSL